MPMKVRNIPQLDGVRQVRITKQLLGYGFSCNRLAYAGAFATLGSAACLLSHFTPASGALGHDLLNGVVRNPLA